MFGDVIKYKYVIKYAVKLRSNNGPAK